MGYEGGRVGGIGCEGRGGVGCDGRGGVDGMEFGGGESGVEYEGRRGG